MEAAPIPAALTKTLGSNAPPQPTGSAGLVGSVLAHLAGASMLLAGLAGAYTAKRRLGIDVFPGVDVLPDPRIEAWIDAMVDLLGW